MKKIIINYFIAFAIILISFNALLFITSLFPSSIIEENVKQSANIFFEEGNMLYLSPKRRNNNYTDVIMVNTAYSIDNTRPFYSYMVARKNYKKGLTQNELADTQKELISFDEGSVISEEYDPVNEFKQFMDRKY